MCELFGMEKKNHHLITFLGQPDKTQALVAKEVGISRGHMSDIVKGRRGPSLDVALRIERCTAGAVPVESWGASDLNRKAS